MRPPFDPDVEFVCTGATVVYGKERNGRCCVAETPREVRELMRTSEEDMLELHHHGDRENPIYVHRGHIIALIPYWSKVEVA